MDNENSEAIGKTETEGEKMESGSDDGSRCETRGRKGRRISGSTNLPSSSETQEERDKKIGSGGKIHAFSGSNGSSIDLGSRKESEIEGCDKPFDGEASYKALSDGSYHGGSSDGSDSIPVPNNLVSQILQSFLWVYHWIVGNFDGIRTFLYEKVLFVYGWIVEKCRVTLQKFKFVCAWIFRKCRAILKSLFDLRDFLLAWILVNFRRVRMFVWDKFGDMCLYLYEKIPRGLLSSIMVAVFVYACVHLVYWTDHGDALTMMLQNALKPVIGMSGIRFANFVRHVVFLVWLVSCLILFQFIGFLHRHLTEFDNQGRYKWLCVTISFFFATIAPIVSVSMENYLSKDEKGLFYQLLLTWSLYWLLAINQIEEDFYLIDCLVAFNLSVAYHVNSDYLTVFIAALSAGVKVLYPKVSGPLESWIMRLQSRRNLQLQQIQQEQIQQEQIQREREQLQQLQQIQRVREGYVPIPQG